MRLTIWILGDQLLRQHPALEAAQILARPDEIRVVLVESASRIARRPVHRKKLVLLLSAMRHYADQLRNAGYVVDYIRAGSVVEGLRQHVLEWQPDRLLTMAAAEFRGRQFQQQGLAALGVEVECLPNTQMLAGRYDPFPEPNHRTLLETFYRAMRRQWGLLIDAEGQPIGGSWNYDAQNRKPLPRAGVVAPKLLSFAPDAITSAVMAEVAALSSGIGEAHDFDLAVTHDAAQAAFDDFIAHRLADFGPYEDAMSSESAFLFHSVLSPYMNIGLLDPLQMAQAVERAYYDGRAPLASVEGFIRQIVGWREYIYWQYWRQMPGLLTANYWQHQRPLPDFFWHGETEMRCLRCVIGRVLAHGYSHHIERLMVLCNFCLLAGIEPAQVNEWFLRCYVDAYEWVVAPNVIGMGLNADGGRTATKPYLASANYINKMSDYCAACRFDPKQRTGDEACPFNFLYWNFLIEHEAVLRSNPRLGPAVLGLKHLSAADREAVQRQAATFLAALPGAGGAY
ncbi:MAG: cryptochrome/photolyase family protein [Anaerolineales bacterium]|nr:cryptochrome/photolyase family protein [Anaerolineales bacterium]